MRWAGSVFISMFYGVVPALASEYAVSLPRTVEISGTQVVFDGKVNYSVPDDACAPISLKVVVPLDDLNAKLTQIVRSTGIEKNESCGDKLEIHGAHVMNAGGNLAAKVEGEVGRQECIKTDVPVFHDLKITMETKVVASTTIDSNASLTAVFDPVVSDNALTVQLVSGPELAISNDILRGVADLFKLDNKVQDKVRDAIQGAVASSAAALQLPATLAGFEFSFDDAHVETIDGRLALVVSGTAPRKQNLIGTFFTYLGGISGTPVTAPPCP